MLFADVSPDKPVYLQVPWRVMIRIEVLNISGVL